MLYQQQQHLSSKAKLLSHYGVDCEENVPITLPVLKTVFFSCQVMDKYGDFYGCEKISELLGLDQALLDFSSERKDKKKLKKDTAWSALWVIEYTQAFEFWFLKWLVSG